ncbi:RCC1 domain-containing protein [Polyangium mundeleinium]|uniref:BNR repeat domain protein n=1 Tax=Polyangium mundeleinium TaxID=2995306 RepID=A0ABT5F540_9BACT|nr:hypothetical protein [Polyangium mundeleinium]MDC0749207.1 hypothetical protein [Polyangium mundeleinium]
MTNARRTFPTLACVATLAVLSAACGARRDVGPGPAVPAAPPPVSAGSQAPPRVWSDLRCLRLADGRVAVASIWRGSDQVILRSNGVSEAPVVDFLCRDNDIMLLLPDGRVVHRYFEASGIGPEKPYDDFTEGRVGFEVKGGKRLVEVTGRAWALVCVAGAGDIRCPRDLKVIYGELEAFGAIRNLYAQGRAALLEDGRFVLGGPQMTNDPDRSPLLLDRVVRAEVADLGFNHIVGCLLRDDASVWCWGPNEFGQLGDGTRERHDKPVRVVGLPRVVDVATSGQHACAIDEQGGVWCWGRSEQGETGEAGREATKKEEGHPVPVRLEEIEGAVAIEAMPGRTWAVRRDGVIVMWGIDAQDGEPRMQAFPVENGAAAFPSSR